MREQVEMVSFITVIRVDYKNGTACLYTRSETGENYWHRMSKTIILSSNATCDVRSFPAETRVIVMVGCVVYASGFPSLGHLSSQTR